MAAYERQKWYFLQPYKGNNDTKSDKSNDNRELGNKMIIRE